MRRFLLIMLAVILCSVGAFAGYVMWDYDPDNVSPMVDVPSYMALFDKMVKERTAGGTFGTLDDARKLRVLGDILASHNGEPAREVALFKARELQDKEAALALLRRDLNSLRDEQYEVAIASIAALGTPKGNAFLDSLYKSLLADPAAHTPLGGYRTSSLTVVRAEPDLNFSFREHSRNDADYTTSKTRESALFFPAGAEYVMEVPNMDDVIGRLNDSRFMKALEGSPVPKDAWQLPMLKTLASLRSRLGETMGFMAPYFSPERFFRDGTMLAKYGNEYLIVSFKDKNVSVAETLIDIFSKLGKDFGIKHWEVNGATLSSVENRKSGKTLNYAVVGDYFVACTDTGLISRAVRTFQTEHENSMAIDPQFAKLYGAVDQTGERDVFFAWFNPTTYFEITGSSSPAARRLSVLARTLHRPVLMNDGAARAGALAAAFGGTMGWSVVSGDDPDAVWRYIVNVRSLGKNPIDSLARLAKMDIGRQIVPYLSPSFALGYGGVDHLKQPYGYSNTSFNVLAAIPLRSAPARFDSTLRVLFGRITSLVYSPETLPGTGTRLWIASDTTTNDSLMRERRLQPSFAVVNNTLLITSTPSLLRTGAAAIQNAQGGTGSTDTYFSGSLGVDAFAANATKYLKSYLLRRDTYSPAEISSRIDPLRNAFGLYDRIEWTFKVENGLRHGDGKLVAKR
ncbi:MAG: hypothetical protein JST22_17425 [Bacteroidetes bacterium]|nr:hypothetical protein [Bacteroidota bacterium]